MGTLAKIYGLYIVIKSFSGWNECSANNFLSFNECGKIYLIVGILIFIIIGYAFGWIKDEEEKENKLDKK